MARFTVGLVALTAVSLATLCEGGAFLDARIHTKDGQVSREDMENAMAQFSADIGMSEYLSEVEREFRPMYAVLPKNQFGNLEPATVRYALHRYFVQKHGWWMMGLESGSVSNTSGQTMILADRAPAVIHSLLEERQQGHGMGLREVAIFASVLTSLISTEVSVLMHDIWNASQLPMDQQVDSVSADQVVKSYMMFYILEEPMTPEFFTQLDRVEKATRLIYPAWDDTAMWVDDFRHTEEFNGKSRSNPFRKPVSTFETTVAFAQEVTHHFSFYQKLECATLKHGLLEMEHQGTGRVLLSRFYTGFLSGNDWTFGESPAYLRNLGALDESDPAKPVVVIPNYVTSKTNCLVGSGFYSLCCADECESLLRHIEAKVAAPSADPSHLAAIVASLPSDTVDAPRNLSSVLLDRLSHIADMHKGSVPLHGRMFAQWMHHVYPRECSQPQVRNVEKVLVPKDWLEKHGKDSIEATEEQMIQYVSKFGTEGFEPVFLPWSTEEELVADNYVVAGAEPWSLMSIRTFAAITLLLSFARAVVQAGAVGCGESTKGESMMV